MKPRRLSQLGVILLFASSIAFAHSVKLKPADTLLADGGGMMAPTAFAGPAPINQASITNLTYTGGTITFNSSTQTLTMTSTITEIFCNSKEYVGDFGTITLTTGPLQSGSILGPATFAGGTFTVTTDGADGLPNGTLLTATLGTVRWHETGNNNMFHLSAPFYGPIFGKGNLHQFSTWMGGNTFNVDQGAATVIPEPTTFALLGTGMLAIIGAMRKFAPRQP
jgi:hypothetical protein